MNDLVSELYHFIPADTLGKSLDGECFGVYCTFHGEVLVYDITNFYSTKSINYDIVNITKFCQGLYKILDKYKPKFILSRIHVLETETDIFMFELVKNISDVYTKLKPNLIDFAIIINCNIEKYDYEKFESNSPYLDKLVNLPNVYQTPYLLHSTYVWYKKLGRFTKWKETNHKFLFLTGKLDKPHRLPALYKFLQSNLKKRLVYSCSKKDLGNCKVLADVMSWTLEKIYNSKDVEDFISNNYRILDGVPENSSWLGVYNLPEEFYNNILIEVVSETDANKRLHITEKTFRPIVLGYPFIHIGRNHYITLREFGFRTFENFSVPNTKINYSPLDHIENAINDTTELFKTITNNNNKTVIRQILDHNQRRAKEIHLEFVGKIKAHIPNFEEFQDQYFLHGVYYPKELVQNYPSLTNLQKS